jgi:hypothetical protein
MALELNKITHLVNDIGAEAAARLARVSERLPVADALLKSVNADDEELMRKITAARQLRWVGAIPTAERPGEVFKEPAHPDHLTIIAADGSQIYPDRHGVAFYYLINVGGIVFRHGNNDAPTVSSFPEVFYEDEDLYDQEDESAVTSDKVNTLRDVRELGELARLAVEEAKLAPTVTLLDNGLLLYLSLRETNRKFAETKLQEYLTHLNTLKAAGAIPAGVVDRPRAANVMRLLKLATMDLNEIGPDTIRSMGQFAQITDAMLFSFLNPGERSALFVNAAPDNDTYEKAGHRTYFFYINVGRPYKPSIMRVEVPEWVATNTEKLALAHAAIVEQCRVSDGFPYVLMRAHELAVVSVGERRAFDEMVISSLMRSGLTPSLSQKAQGKQWTGAAKTRYP